jgi:hypothetical protein
MIGKCAEPGGVAAGFGNLHTFRFAQNYRLPFEAEIDGARNQGSSHDAVGFRSDHVAAEGVFFRNLAFPEDVKRTHRKSGQNENGVSLSNFLNEALGSQHRQGAVRLSAQGIIERLDMALAPPIKRDESVKILTNTVRYYRFGVFVHTQLLMSVGGQE